MLSWLLHLIYGVPKVLYHHIKPTEFDSPLCLVTTKCKYCSKNC